MKYTKDAIPSEDIDLASPKAGFVGTHGQERLDRLISERGDLRVDAIPGNLK